LPYLHKRNEEITRRIMVMNADRAKGDPFRTDLRTARGHNM